MDDNFNVLLPRSTNRANQVEFNLAQARIVYNEFDQAKKSSNRIEFESSELA